MGGIMSSYQATPVFAQEDVEAKLNAVLAQQYTHAMALTQLQTSITGLLSEAEVTERVNAKLNAAMVQQRLNAVIAQQRSHTMAIARLQTSMTELLSEEALTERIRAIVAQQEGQHPRPPQAETQSLPQSSVKVLEPSRETYPRQYTVHTASPDDKEEKSRNPVVQMIFNALFYLLIIAMVGGGLMFALSNDPEKSYFGYRFYNVKTPSMTPAADGSSPPGGFRAGDSILVQMVDPAAIQVGDIITYVPGDDPDVYLTHRVVEKLDHLNEDEGLFFVTKGDANESNDLPITADRVIGKKVLAVPNMGAVMNFIQQNALLCMVVIVSAIGAVVLFRMYFLDPERADVSKDCHALT